jgi:hypothetical protein
MKTPIILGLALLVAAPVQAQLFRPSLNGALLGGIAGAIIGNNSGSLHHNAWQGAAIGAGAGLLLDAMTGYPSAAMGPTAYPGSYIYRDGYRGYRGGYYGYGSAASDGLWLGALAGGVIGHNSRGFRHDGWRGAAWGAGAGWLLGSIIDSNRYYGGYGYDYGYGYPRAVVMAQPQPVAVQSAAPAVAPQQITIINNYYGNAAPMASANALFGR